MTETRTAVAPPVAESRSAAVQSTDCPLIQHEQGAVLYLTPTLRELADILANLRKASHDGRRRPEQDLGDGGNTRADRYGARLEVALKDALERCGHTPQGWTLFNSTGGVSGADFELNGRRYDCKALLPGCQFVTISAAKHRDTRYRPDAYIVGQFVSETTIRLFLVRAGQVDSWEERSGHSTYLSRDITELTPIRALRRRSPE